MDFGRLIGAVLGGATQPPRRRTGTARRGTGPFGLTQTEQRQIGRVVGALAGIAADALANRTSTPEPAPAPPPRPKAPASPAPRPGGAALV
ncbi:MAG: hypothetical protein K2X11_15135, partial [Acetobacteraceae bacterium]|nr:hypothetical protein [Acetobacteraceae bacterium]